MECFFEEKKEEGHIDFLARGWQTMARQPNLAQCLFLSTKFYWNAATHLFSYCLWLLCFAIAEWSSCNRDGMALKA